METTQKTLQTLHVFRNRRPFFGCIDSSDLQSATEKPEDVSCDWVQAGRPAPSPQVGLTDVAVYKPKPTSSTWSPALLTAGIEVPFFHFYNDDIAYVEGVAPEAGELSAGFDGRSIVYGFGTLDALVPAYAATVHKSQGLEYPAVVIPIPTRHYAMLQRNLLYTGVTRGKRLIVLVAQKKAVAIAMRNVPSRRRWSKLKEWLGVEKVT